MAGGDVTKTDYVLYEESFTNLIHYSQAMPRYDDEDRPKKGRAETSKQAKNSDWEVTKRGGSSTKGSQTIITGDTKTRKGMGFGDFINAMASIKGGFDENNE